MKIGCLIFSLLLNAVLVLTLRTHLRSQAASDTPPNAETGALKSAHGPKPIPVDAQAWDKFQDGSQAELVSRLRAQGFPRPIVAVIVGYEIDELQADQRSAILATRKPIEYWKYSYWTRSGLDEKGEHALDELDREKGKQLRALLGPDAPTDYTPELLKKMVGNISEEKAREIFSIQGEYSEEARRFRVACESVYFPEDRAKLKALDQACQIELAETLTPAELKDFQLHGSEPARNLRRQLAAFSPSDDEFEKVFTVQQAFDQKYGKDDLTPEEKQKRKEAEGQLAADLQRALGPERFAEYEKKTDSVYRDTYEFVSLAQRDPKVTDDLISLRRDVTARAENTRVDPSLNAAQREAQLSALAGDADAKLLALLGATAADNYRRELGNWLKKIHPGAAH
jgi:hypothetical protein